MMLLPLACSDINADGPVDTKVDAGLMKNWAFWENKIDKTKTNQYTPIVFCHEWEFVSTELERWEGGQLVEMKKVDNVFPYRKLKILKNGSMSADGMGGVWDYRYNNLMIDVSTSGGSNYLYQVIEVKGGKISSVISTVSYIFTHSVIIFNSGYYFFLVVMIKEIGNIFLNCFTDISLSSICRSRKIANTYPIRILIVCTANISDHFPRGFEYNGARYIISSWIILFS